MSRPVLVLVSGLAADEATWRPQLDALDAEIECRPMALEGQTIDEMVDAILAGSPPRFALAGHSLGGSVALALQRRAPDQVQGLALLNTNAAADDDKQRENRHAILAAVERAGYEAVVDRLLDIIGGPHAEPAVLDEIKAMLLRVGAGRFRRDHLAALVREDSRPGLAGISVPTLVIDSAADRIVPPEASAEIASLVPGADLRMINGVGHISTLEAPSSVEAALRQWLDRVFDGDGQTEFHSVAPQPAFSPS